MTDEALDRALGATLRAFAEGGVRPIDPLAVAARAMDETPPRRWLPAWWPPAGLAGWPAGAAAAIAGLLVIAVVVSLVPEERRPGAAIPPGPTPAPATPQATPQPMPTASLPDELAPGPYDISTPAGTVHLTLPAGWRAAADGSAVFTGDEAYETTPNGPSFGVQDVTSLVADTCLGGQEPSFVPVGPSARELTAALEAIEHLDVVGPTAVIVGGYVGRKLVLRLPDDFENACGGPEGRFIWRNETAQPFALLNGGVATVYVIDVHDVRLVLATHYRGASREQQQDLARIVTSVRIDSAALFPHGNVGPNGDLPVGRHTTSVDGVAFSFEVPSARWEQFGYISLNKSIREPQSAEAMIYWTRLPAGSIAWPCQGLRDPLIGPSMERAAATVASARGTELVEGPADTVVGGRPAIRLVFTIREDDACDPGFFFAWDDAEVGSRWVGTTAGDTIRAWIVDLDGSLMFIGGVSKPDAGQALEDEIDTIVASIRILRTVGPG